MNSKTKAGLYDIAKKTPLQLANNVSRQIGCKVYLKREDLQPVHSFKIRGAYNKIASLTAKEKSCGVIAASAGNHAQGVALSAKKLGIKALIVMPKTTPSIKVDAVIGYGAEVELFGDNFSEAFDYCLQRIGDTGMTLIHPFDDLLVIEGQGTVADELLEQNPKMTHLFVPVGGGGLLAGVAQVIKKVRPDIKIISVEPADSNAMQTSIKHNRIVELPHVGIFADGVAVRKVGNLTFEIAQKKVDDFISVNTDQVCAAIKSIFEDTRSIVEPAGALSLAGIQSYDLPSNAVAVAICSGANISFERLQLIAERTLLGSGREGIYAIELPDKNGALLSLCRDVINGHNITEFNYRTSKLSKATIFVGIGFSGIKDKEILENNLKAYNYKFKDLSTDEIAKEHIRHMIGGKFDSRGNEHVYSILFPERPGALVNFLENMGDENNISLFHYRGLGGDDGRVLIGYIAENKLLLEKSLKSTNYDFVDVTKNLSIKLFT